jgi:hypothetical protein
LDLAGDEIRQRSTGALIRHVNEIDLCEVLQVFAAKVQRRTAARGRVIELSRTRARERDQLAHGFRRY